MAVAAGAELEEIQPRRVESSDIANIVDAFWPTCGPRSC
jgi:hypothetical protein